MFLEMSSERQMAAEDREANSVAFRFPKPARPIPAAKHMERRPPAAVESVLAAAISTGRSRRPAPRGTSTWTVELALIG
jgi:hypothetical protein